MKSEPSMIQVTRINRNRFVLNSDLIEQIESTPDTVITLTNGQKLVVMDSEEEIVRKVIAFRRSVVAGPARTEDGCNGNG
jgi:flagellar protein FlbD